MDDNIKPPQNLITEHPESGSKKILFTIITAIILATIGLAVYYFVIPNLRSDSKLQTANPEDVVAVLSALIENYKNVENYEFDGKFDYTGKRENVSNELSGQVYFNDGVVYSRGDIKRESVYHEGVEEREWQDKVLTNQQTPRWLVLEYAESLEYIATTRATGDRVLHHYKIQPKDYDFGDALTPIRQFGIQFGVNAFDANRVPIEIEGEIWVDDQFLLAKESFKLPLQNAVATIDLNYNNYEIGDVMFTGKTDEELAQKFLESEKNELKIGRLTNVATDLSNYFRNNNAYPQTLVDLDVEARLGFDYSEFSYAVNDERDAYHLGVQINSLVDKIILEQDADFDSKDAGWQEGFSGDDPVYDLHGVDEKVPVKIQSEELEEIVTESYGADRYEMQTTVHKFRGLWMALEMFAWDKIHVGSTVYDNNGRYPLSLNELNNPPYNDFLPKAFNPDTGAVELTVNLNEYLYAVKPDRSEYHIGIQVNPSFTLILEDEFSGSIDSDFNSSSTGWQNGFNGADPVLDFHSTDFKSFY